MLLCALALATLLPMGTAGASEADLVLPDLSTHDFIGSINGHELLLFGLFVCLGGMLFGLLQYMQIKKLPVHRSMLEISDLIYETCKTYLLTQGKFLAMLWLILAVIMVVYFGFLLEFGVLKVATIILFSIIGMLGSYGVAWFGIRINTLANSRTAFASLGGKPFPTMDIPLKSGMSIGMLLISVELVMMLFILLFVPGDWAGPCFIGFA
ncbi:MAG: sodium/proton-translocating pyrophosphatase, partial [FCB group bacterium]|nr:sodium/proton-translocating pyrophosphatase [FCB group bacterium]